MPKRWKIGLVTGIILLIPLVLWALLPGQQDDSLDKEITNSIGMNLVLVRAGSFRMGAGSSEPQIEQLLSERPKHYVEITQPFYMGACEVTVKEYELVMGSHPAPLLKGGPEFPVTLVSWEEAALFCDKLSSMAGEKEGSRRYRLPTEAEWEYACRAGTTTAQFCASTQLAQYAWVKSNSALKTHPVGTLKPNKWGLYDMLGNVWEWCADYADPAYYANSPTRDPQASPPNDPTLVDRRVIRGGAFGGESKNCRSAGRLWWLASDRNWDIGFRVVCAVPSRPE